jgi:gamma-glutamylaminecyclotransferase
MNTLYFSYGSNMDDAQMARRCPGAARVGRAFLENYKLAFVGSSYTWYGGGVATAAPAEGERLPGVLWRVHGAHIRNLDRFEGTPHSYVRIKQPVTRSRQSFPAHIYFATSDALNSPSLSYSEIIRKAHRRIRVGADVLLDARRDVLQSRTVRVFVYGTLMKGEGNHRRLLRDVPCAGKARTAPEFDFYSLVGFPGLVRGGELSVRGEVYDVDGLTLAHLDVLEGHPKFYQRERIELDDGGEAIAYLLQPGDVEGCDRIPSGDWRKVQRRH